LHTKTRRISLTPCKLLAVIGGQFHADSELCGVIVSIRFNEDIISVWNKTAEDKKAKAEI